MVQLSHPYMTNGKTIALTRQTFVDKVMSLLFNMLSRLVISFLLKSKCLLISWLQSPYAVILEPKKIKSGTLSTLPHLFALKWWDRMNEKYKAEKNIFSALEKIHRLLVKTNVKQNYSQNVSRTIIMATKELKVQQHQPLQGSNRLKSALSLTRISDRKKQKSLSQREHMQNH